METRTLSTVLGEKLADLIDRTDLGKAAKYVSLFFVAGLISAAAVSADRTADLLERILMSNDAAVTKVIIVFALVFNARRIWDFIVGLVPERETETIEGIPTVELLDHLFTEQSLRTDVHQKFGVPQYRIERLVKHLKRVGVLTSGANNATVLNADFTRQDVATLLSGKDEASQIDRLFRRDDRGLTSSPIPSPTPVKPVAFTTRTLATVS